jgi:hypothetical protein
MNDVYMLLVRNLESDTGTRKCIGAQRVVSLPVAKKQTKKSRKKPKSSGKKYGILINEK